MCPTVLETGVLVIVSTWFGKDHLLSQTFHCILYTVDGDEGALLGLFYKSLSLIQPHNLVTPKMPHLLILSHCQLEFHYMNFERHRHSYHNNYILISKISTAEVTSGGSLKFSDSNRSSFWWPRISLECYWFVLLFIYVFIFHILCNSFKIETIFWSFFHL